MVIPDRDPGEVLVAGNEIQVGSVGGMALAVVVKSKDGVVRLGDTSQAVAPATKAMLAMWPIFELGLLTIRRSCIRRCSHCIQSVQVLK